MRAPSPWKAARSLPAALLLALLASLFTVGDAWGRLLAGVGQADITPPVGTPLAGYSARAGRPSTGVLDRLHAKALALRDGREQLVLVATDLIGTSPHVKREVARLTGIPSRQLLLCASHTHSGPGAFAEGPFAQLVMGRYDPKVFRGLCEGIAGAAKKALGSLAPARVGAAAVDLPGLTRNRRGGTLTDPRLTLVRFDRSNGKPLAALVHFTAHGTVLGADNMRFSGDWMGALQRRLQQRLRVPVLYLNGAEGDQAPVVEGGLDRREAMERFGARLAERAERLARTLRPIADARLRVSVSSLLLPEGDGLRSLGVPKEVELQAAWIGDLCLAAVPGEPTVELGKRIKAAARRAGARYPLVLGLANNHLGYLLSRADYEKGGYERLVSFFGPDFGDTLAAAAADLAAGRSAAAARAPTKAQPAAQTSPPAQGDRSRREDSPLIAGAAKAVITPTKPVFLAGYEANRRSTGVHDDLYARCLYLKKGDGAVALVGLDLMGLSKLHVDQIRRRVRGIALDRIVIASTHTHSAPDTYGQWGPSPTTSGVDPEYLRWMQDRVVAVVEEAVRSAKPARLKLASVKSVDQASRNIRVPQILDTELAALQALSLDGSPIATLVNYACHPEVMHTTEVSADFAGALCKRLEERGGGMGLFLNGALGGMVTGVILHPDEGGNHERDAERIGHLLADTALEALSAARPAEVEEIRTQRAEFAVPLENQRFQALMEAGVLPKVVRDGSMTTEVCRVVVGPAEMVTIPGEATPDLGLLLKREMSGSPQFVIGLGNDELGYILPEESYGLHLYRYESSVSVGPRIGPLVKENLRKLISLQPLRGAPSVPAAFDPDAWFAALPSKVTPDATLNATFQVRLTGGRPGLWWVRTREGEATTGSGPVEAPDVTLEATSEDFFQIVEGKLDPLAALLTGKVKLEGDLSIAQKLPQVFRRKG